MTRRWSSVQLVLLVVLLVLCVSPSLGCKPEKTKWKLSGKLIGNYNGRFTITYNMMLLAELVSGTEGDPDATYFVLSGHGSRTLVANHTTTKSVLLLTGPNGVGGNDNLLYPYSREQYDEHALLDFDGLTFNVTKTSKPGHVEGFGTYESINLFWDTGANPRAQYSEEGASGEHELGITKNTFKATKIQ